MKPNIGNKLPAAGILSSLAMVSWSCLYICFTDVFQGDFLHFSYITYLVTLAMAITALTEFADEDRFLCLRYLVDYLQLVLALPCHTAEIWLRYEVAPMEICMIHAGLGFLAAMYFIIMEWKRQDLADLAIISNALSLVTVGILNSDPYAVASGIVYAGAYLKFKREDPCFVPAPEKFNGCMSTFCVLSIMSFSPKLPEPLNQILYG